MTLTFGSLFAGIGGFDLGLVQAGLRPLWYAEIDEKCSALMAERAPGIPNMGDVRNVKKETVEPVDVVVGGFPCQDLSVAGKRKGLAGERSGLWFEFHRVLAEIRPQWAVIENVPGLLSSNGGRDFAIILSGLAEIGYSTAWRILDAQYYGVAQRRRRVFIVASLGNGRCAEVLFERESLSWDSAPCRETGAGVAPTVATGINGSGLRGRQPGSAATMIVAPSLTAAPYADNEAQHGKLVVANPIASHNGRDSGEDNFIVGALSAHSQRHGHAMTTQQAAESGQLVTAIRNSGRDSDMRPGRQGTTTQDEVMYSLQAEQQHAIAFQPRYYTRDNKTGGAPSECADITNAHKAGDSAPVIAFQSKASASQSMNPSEVAPALDVGKADGMAVGVRSGVRRLTPTECEILQGFIPGWTANGQSDSARYRQLGNAVCTRKARWIGRQIIKASQ